MRCSAALKSPAVPGAQAGALAALAPHPRGRCCSLLMRGRLQALMRAPRRSSLPCGGSERCRNSPPAGGWREGGDSRGSGGEQGAGSAERPPETPTHCLFACSLACCASGGHTPGPCCPPGSSNHAGPSAGLCASVRQLGSRASPAGPSGHRTRVTSISLAVGSATLISSSSLSLGWYSPRRRWASSPGCKGTGQGGGGWESKVCAVVVEGE